MSHNSFILNEYGSYVFMYEELWAKYCQENGIENPIHKKHKIFRERLRPSVVPFGNTGITFNTTEILPETEEQKSRMPTEEEINLYQKSKYLFIARRMFKDKGYEMFEKYATINFPELLTQDEFKPCTSADGQCNLFCKYKCEESS